MDFKPKLYVLDDDQLYAELLTDIASNAGWQVESEQSASTFLASDLPQSSILVLDLVGRSRYAAEKA